MLMRAKYIKHKGGVKIKWSAMKDDGGWTKTGGDVGDRGGSVWRGKGEGSTLVCLVS